MSVVISLYCNGSLLIKSIVILQQMMYCNFTTDGGDEFLKL